MRQAIEHWQQGEEGEVALVHALSLGANTKDARVAATTSAQLSLGQALLMAGLDDQGLRLLEHGRQQAEANVAGWDDWEAVRSQACEALVEGDWPMAQSMVNHWVTNRPYHVPPGVGERSWTELLLNACSAWDDRLPAWWLVESRSLPRSGHHFLKGLLQKAWTDDFSYCEGYQEPGCCKTSPCAVFAHWHFAREHRRNHLRLLKSHDFSLADTAFEPLAGMVRLIQIRRPLHLLVSWLELQQLAFNEKVLQDANIPINRIFLYHEKELIEEAWRVVDAGGSVMASDEVQKWLIAKTDYISRFLNKWLPLATPFPFGKEVAPGGNYIIRYEELGRWGELLASFGRTPQEKQVTITFEPQPQVMKRRSAKVTALIKSSQDLLMRSEVVIMGRVPDVKAMYSSPS